MKIGRNDPCWCGSGKKFKTCHLNRENQDRFTVQDVIKENKKAKNKICFHPEANSNTCNKIIKAHSIQKSNILQKISRKQHVYSFSAEIGDLMKHNRLEPKLIGINNASTFTGFCNYHDTETFKPIEINDIDISNEHIFLIAYRSLCKEIYAKTFQSNMMPLTKQGDKGFGIDEQIAFQELMEIYNVGVKAGLNDLLEYKKIYDSYLLSKNFNAITYYVIEVEGVPDILSSGQIHVEMDFQGNRLQTHEEILDFSKVLDRISFSILLNSSNGLIIFSCFSSEKKGIDFLKSISRINDSELPNAIVRFAFEFFENNFISPNWWDRLTNKIKESIIKRMNSSVSFSERPNDILKDDGNTYVNWKILNRYQNF